MEVKINVHSKVGHVFPMTIRSELQMAHVTWVAMELQ